MVEEARINEHCNAIEVGDSRHQNWVYRAWVYTCTYAGCVHEIIPTVPPLLFQLSSSSGGLGVLLSPD